MRVEIATEPAPGREVNEDAALFVGSLVGVFDGVTEPGINTGCVHNPSWYVARLTTRLTEVAGEWQNGNLREILAEAIERVRGDHGGLCDLSNPATPAATSCLLRRRSDSLEYLILSDCTLVIDQAGEVSALTDQRFGNAVAELRRGVLKSPGIHASGTGPTLGKYALTNQPSGYWIAAANPQAAHEAISGQLSLGGPRRIRRAALLTDGTSCAVDRYGLMNWQQLLDLLSESGPRELIRQVRGAENGDPDGLKHPRYKRHDDATAALCTFEESRNDNTSAFS